MRQVREGKDRIHVFRGQENRCCFCTKAENLWRSATCSKSSLAIHWCVPYRRPNLPAISEMVVCCSPIILQPLAGFSCEYHLERQPEFSQCSTELFPHLNWGSHSNVCSPHGVTESCFEHLSYSQSSILKQYLTKIFSGTQNLSTACNMHSEHTLRKSAVCHGCTSH